MRSSQRSNSRFAQAINLFSGRDASARRVLSRSVCGSFTSQDTGAALLGSDLWFTPLREYRDYLLTVAERPHLWRFAFEPSGAWPSAVWRSLPIETRVVRMRIASPDRGRDFVFSPSELGMRAQAVARALHVLEIHGLADEVRGGVHRIYPIAPPSELHPDLHLVEIISHWLHMLSHADAIARNHAPSGYEVYGYDGACKACRTAWGIRPKTPEAVPPFHPGCRCFAQPRFFASSENIRR